MSAGVDRIPEGSAETISRRLAREFEERHGRRPAAVLTAPGRVNLMGEHTDYNGGPCLPVALPHAAYAAVGPRTDGVLSVTSLQQDRSFVSPVATLSPEGITGWAAYAAGVVWALRETGADVPGIDIVVDSRVPMGAGLASSAALECSVAVAACTVAGLPLSADRRRDLVAVCMRAEQEVAGAPTGGMDQTIALLGRRSHALLIDCGRATTEQVAWAFPPAAAQLLVIDTRAGHAHADGQYGSRRAECEAAAAELGVDLLAHVPDVDRALATLESPTARRRVRHVLAEGERVRQAVQALEALDAEGLGRLFSESHASMRDDFEISCPELDVVVDTAMQAGALGARMTGGGFGGSAVALVPGSRVDDVANAVARAFETNGWPPPGHLSARPSAGARALPT